MALNYRRGSAAIEESATVKSSFRPFLPQIGWRENGEKKTVICLTDIEEVAKLLLHQFIPVGKGTKANGEEFTRWEDFVSRKDRAIGEDYDDLEDRLERQAKERHLGILAEVEPVMETVDGRKKLKSFVVKTEEFTRRTEDGEEEVVAPAIGLCTNSHLLWSHFNSLARSEEIPYDLIEFPVEITRHGKDKNTHYTAIPFLEKPVDLSPIVNHVEGISYLLEDLEEVQNLIDAVEGDVAKAQVIADFMLNKRITELGDGERYEELVTPLHLEDMPKNPFGKKPATNKRPARPARRSPRESNGATEPVEDEPTKTERFAALKRRVENQ